MLLTILNVSTAFAATITVQTPLTTPFPFPLSSCALTSATYMTCNNLVTFAATDSLVLSGTTPITIEFKGGVNIQNNNINYGGSSNNLNLYFSGGNVTIASNANITANINSTVAMSIAANVTLIGDINSSVGVTTGNNTIINGNLIVTGGATLTTTLTDYTKITGNIYTEGILVVRKYSVISGDIMAYSINAGISTENNISFGGDVVSRGGAIYIGQNNSVNGMIKTLPASGNSTNSNTITASSGSTENSCIMAYSTTSNKIILGSGSSPTSVCCYNNSNNTCSTSCVANNSGKTVNICPASMTTQKINITGGVLADYFNTSKTLTGNDKLVGEAINLSSTYTNFGSGQPSSMTTMTPLNNGDNFSIRYKGFFYVRTSGYYSFNLSGDDGIRLYLDCTKISPNIGSAPNLVKSNIPDYPTNLVIDKWVDGSNNNATYSCKNQWKAGDIIPFVIDYYENTGSSFIYLNWFYGSSVGSNSLSGSTPVPRGVTTINTKNSARGLYYDKSAVSDTLVNAFLINTNGSTGTTCIDKPITITALDATGNPISDFSGAITISTSTNHGNFTLNKGSGIFTPGNIDSGTATYVYSALDGGSATFNFNPTMSETLTIKASIVSPTVSTTSSAITFSSSLANLFDVKNDAIQVAGKTQVLTVTAKSSLSCSN